MTRTVLCFGDSNTHGTPPIVTPGEYRRFDPSIRWTSRLSDARTDWTVIDDGLPGRTAQFEDPIMGSFMDGRPGLRIALQSHGPIDALTIMLGTNDVKTRFAPTPKKVTGGLAALLDIALSIEMQTRHDGFRVLLICPAPVQEVGPIKGEFFGAAAISNALPRLYRSLAEARSISFLNAGDHIQTSDQDGIHLEPTAHETLANLIADWLNGI